ncbi:964_t:CDS:2 [Acaulospora morrowiae]|uniref:964_t:CDS:1 n=1 Tax=Acaulospora morrowiae TaxID=94023 RepID=A0A9N8YS89_9GLOM|nr:964_t:CDS:2 [Acaulospora morrowiae]
MTIHLPESQVHKPWSGESVKDIATTTIQKLRYPSIKGLCSEIVRKTNEEWHNIDSYVTKLLENNPGLSENDCFAVCSNQISDWSNSVSKYASTLLSKWKGLEKQKWLELAKKAFQHKLYDEKISSNNASRSSDLEDVESVRQLVQSHRTIREQNYEKVKGSIVEKLCKIFQSEYSEVESKIISETKLTIIKQQIRIGSYSSYDMHY